MKEWIWIGSFPILLEAQSDYETTDGKNIKDDSVLTVTVLGSGHHHWNKETEEQKKLMSILAKTTMNFALWCKDMFYVLLCAVSYKKEHNLRHGVYVVYIEVSIWERRIITCLQCDRFVFIMVRVHQVEINLTQLWWCWHDTIRLQ